MHQTVGKSSNGYRTFEFDLVIKESLMFPFKDNRDEP